MSLCGCAKDSSQPPVSDPPPVSFLQSEPPSSPPSSPQNPDDSGESAVAGEVVVAFDYEKQSGYASNQFAVWIEDMDGNLIKTLYATRYTVNGGYKNRPDSIPTWVEKSGLSVMNKNETDAVTGATPKADTLSYVWDLTDRDGSPVVLGQYRFFVEGSLRWKNRVLYSGVIEISYVPATVQAERQFFFEANDNQAALSDDSSEITMIGAVTASFVPEEKNG